MDGRKKKCIFMAFFLCLVVSLYSAEELSDTDLLRLIADGYEDNLSRLRTWQGSAIREGFDDGEGIKWSERLDFISDRDQKANLWRGNRIRDLGENQTIELNSGMNKTGYTYKMDFLGDRSSGNVSELLKGTLLIYNEEKFPQGVFTPSFDPIRELISTLGVDGQLGGALRVWADDIENSPGPEGSFEIRRENSKVTLILYATDDETGKVDKNCFSLYAFDLKKGYSLIESHDLDAQGDESHWILDYEEHNGVFVPNKMIVKSVDGKNKTSSTRKIILTTKSVNEEIPSSEFQYNKLGLYPGDYILDHSAGGVRYRWADVDVISDDVAAILESMTRDVAGQGVSQRKDEQEPEVVHATDDKLPNNNIIHDDNAKMPVDYEMNATQRSGKGYIVISAILMAIALCFVGIRIKRAKNVQQKN